jgi:uncharacterized protein (TIGR00251 family)
VVLSVWVKPRASRTRVTGVHGDALAIQLAAPPVDGAANAELIRFLAEALEVPRRQVTLLSGDTSRGKRVEVSGTTPAQALTLLP